MAPRRSRCRCPRRRRCRGIDGSTCALLQRGTLDSPVRCLALERLDLQRARAAVGYDPDEAWGERVERLRAADAYARELRAARERREPSCRAGVGRWLATGVMCARAG